MYNLDIMSQLEKDLRREADRTAVLWVQTTVEGVLQSASLITLVGLSTNPDLVDQAITPETLRGKCGTICGDLQDRLKPAGVLVDMCISGDRNSSWHRYLGTIHNGVEVIMTLQLANL